MKKHKSKSKSTSENKKLRKELESKLVVAFNEVLGQFGKAKKTDKVIEKFAKQLSKKISVHPKDDSITAFIKDEEGQPIATPDNASAVSTKKPTVKKTKPVAI
ncbi:hypothetical protein [Pedobacter endophyticus]|uniref:Uncharacterized protein n=1 Tax=Pedobacter endophyticus TaxID=2789740 RepID=A0A7S9KYG5_9SPHI|nr:hypothetical protein [Pedobacter endophyticus]QPH39165.1 hypothetical protein IZT61_19250 [Pedobacter endophyticus]